jgi:DNA-3-methyladenine glycosylase
MMALRLPGRMLSRAFFEDSPERVAPRLLGKLLIRRVGERELIAGRIVEVEAYLGPHHETPDRAAHSHRGPTPRNQVLFGPAGHAYVYSIYGRYFCMNITCEPVGRAGCILLRALEPVMGLEQMARNRGMDDLPPFSQRTRKGWGNKGGEIGFPPFSHKTREGWGNDEVVDPRISRPAKGTRNGWGAGSAWGAARALASGPSRLCQALGITRAADNAVDLLDARSALQVRDDGFRVSRVRVTARIGIRHAAELPLRFCLEGHGCVSGPKRMQGRELVLS